MRVNTKKLLKTQGMNLKLEKPPLTPYGQLIPFILSMCTSSSVEIVTILLNVSGLEMWDRLRSSKGENSH